MYGARACTVHVCVICLLMRRVCTYVDYLLVHCSLGEFLVEGGQFPYQMC